MLNNKGNYSWFFRGHPAVLHFTAHSHHFWPDVSRRGHMLAWDDAAKYSDDKWNHIFTSLIPEVQKHIAYHLGLSKPKNIVFGGSTHELIFRLLSGHDFFTKRFVVLTTDGEFKSFSRQIKRLSELPFVEVLYVPIFPFSSFKKRFLAAAKKHRPDFTYVSHVFFETGQVVPHLDGFVKKIKPHTETLVIDGYHGFCAVPTSLSSIENDIFYVAGGYKYAQSGEGCAFMSVPDGCKLRPLYTGWFAEMDALQEKTAETSVLYSDGAQRFMGSTFDPTGLYRMNAVMDWMKKNELTISIVHKKILSLQEYFLDKLARENLTVFTLKNIVTPITTAERAHFLSFTISDAKNTVQRLKDLGVVVDSRGDCLRIGFGLYHSAVDIDRLVDTLTVFEQQNEVTK